MADQIEKENSSNLEPDEQVELETAETEVHEAPEDVDALKEQNRQLFARAKKAETLLKAVKTVPETKVTAPAAPTKDEDVDARVNAVLEKRELESLEVSDDLKAKIATYAKVNSVSVKQALKSDYIKFCKEQEESKDDADKASLPTGRKGATRGPAPAIANIDPRTPEGAKALEKMHEENRKKLG